MATEMGAREARSAAMNTGGRSLLLPGALLGIGLGGFFDGIVLHQVLQWHHMVSNEVAVTTVAGLEANTLADGLFHAAAWVVTLAGVALLFVRSRRGVSVAGWALAGWMLLGWGVFNLVEGVVDHHILQLHHVRPGANELAYDIGFLVFGALLVAVGWAMATRSEARGNAGSVEVTRDEEGRRAA